MPQTRALARVDVARSLREARADQIIPLDPAGNVRPLALPPARLLVPMVALPAVLPVIGVAIAGLGGALAGTLASFAILHIVWLRPCVAYSQAMARFSRGELEQAEAMIRARPRAGIGAWKWDYLAAKIAWKRGDLDRALATMETAIEAGSRRRGHRRDIEWIIASLELAQLHAAAGDVASAHKARRHVPRLPAGDFVQQEGWFTDLLIAFAADDPRPMPRDPYDWAREALSTTMAAGHLVLLAWLYHRRGDDDMARHLLRSAEDNLAPWHLDRTLPQLDAWRRRYAAG